MSTLPASTPSGSQTESLSFLESGAVSAQQAESRRLVRAMMALTGRTASGLAKAAGLTPSTLNRFMHKPVRHNLSQQTLLNLLTLTLQDLSDRPDDPVDQQALGGLAPALGIYARGILELDPSLENTLARALGNSMSDSVSDSQKELPVVMVTSQGIKVRSKEWTGAPFFTERPPFLALDDQAFSVIMPDESMVPRFDPEDLLYVSPSRTLNGGHPDVVIERKQGGFLIGRLTAITSGHIALSVLKPQVTEFLARDSVAGIYPIVGLRRG